MKNISDYNQRFPYCAEFPKVIVKNTTDKNALKNVINVLFFPEKVEAEMKEIEERQKFIDRSNEYAKTLPDKKEISYPLDNDEYQKVLQELEQKYADEIRQKLRKLYLIFGSDQEPTDEDIQKEMNSIYDYYIANLRL